MSSLSAGVWFEGGGMSRIAVLHMRFELMTWLRSEGIPHIDPRPAEGSHMPDVFLPLPGGINAAIVLAHPTGDVSEDRLEFLEYLDRQGWHTLAAIDVGAAKDFVLGLLGRHNSLYGGPPENNSGS